MSRRRRPHYQSDLGWILGIAFEGTLTRSDRPVQGFTFIRCCGSPRASSPHGLTATGQASHDGRPYVQLPPARGCYQLAPRRTFTSNPVPMPGTPPCRSPGALTRTPCRASKCGSQHHPCGTSMPSRGRPPHPLRKNRPTRTFARSALGQVHFVRSPGTKNERPLESVRIPTVRIP